MISESTRHIMSKSRIEAFSDGVFAIILTLLIFNFKVPPITGGDVDVQLQTKLLAMHPYFVTYVMTFALISLFWISHHNLFHALKHSSGPLLWFNNVFLLFLAFIPFPTQVLGAYPEAETATIFFGLAMVCASLSFTALRYYCYFRAKLADDTVTNDEMRHSLIRGLVGAGLYVVAIILSAYSQDITLSMYAMVPFLIFVPTHVRKRPIPKSLAEAQEVRVSLVFKRNNTVQAIKSAQQPPL